MIVISDSSAISNLLQIGQFELLKTLYNKIYISPAVQRELYIYDKQAKQIEELKWIEIRYPKNQKLVQQLLNDLDLGEAESIVLALEEEADYLIIDEYLGRKIAHSMDIKVVGILGILIFAKQQGLVSEIRSSIELLLSIGFRLNKELINSILTALNETEI